MISTKSRSRVISSVLIAALALGFLGVGLVPSTAEAQEETQEESSQVFAQVDYMKAKPGDAAEYLNLERNLWKPIHQERANDGKILGWYLYEVRYPAGTGHDYNYVTVTFYDSMAEVESSDLETYAQRAHPDRALGVMADRTYDVRKQVRSELWMRLDELAPEGSPSGPAPFLRLDYMKVPAGGASDYVSLEQDMWKPVHRARLEAGTISSWGLWQMNLPGGTSQQYSHATVTGYQSMTDMPGYPEGIWKEVHPNKNLDEIAKQTYATRDLVQTELWELVDSVSGAASTP